MAGISVVMFYCFITKLSNSCILDSVNLDQPTSKPIAFH